jgi:hippurate hydrolase
VDIKQKIKQLSAKYSKQIIELRRKIHQNPELSFNQFETTKLITQKIKKLRIDKVQRLSETGVVGLIKNKSGKCVALRADFDALPIH